jgi:hypothetical protein
MTTPVFSAHNRMVHPLIQSPSTTTLDDTPASVNIPSETPRPIFDGLIAEGTLPAGFSLGEHERTIRHLLDKWHLHPSLCLLDLIGLDVLRGIQLLQSELEPEVKTLFCAQVFLFYVNSKRDADCYRFLEADLTTIQMYERQSKRILQHIQRVNQSAESASILKEIKHRSNRTLKPQTIAYVTDQTIKQRQELKATLDLLICFIQMDDAKSRVGVLFRKISDLSGNHSILKDSQKTLDHTKQYLEYCNSLFSAAAKEHLCPYAIHFNYITLDKNGMHLQESLSSLNLMVDQMRAKAAEEFVDLTAASEGRLNHGAWLKRKKIKQIDMKSSREFKEALFARLEAVIMYISFAKDLYSIVDEILLPQTLPTWISVKELKRRFWIYFFSIRPGSLNEDSFINSAQKTIRSHLYSHFLPVYNGVEVLKREARKSSQALDVAFSIKEQIAFLRLPSQDEHTLKIATTLSTFPVTEIPLPEKDKMHSLILGFRDLICDLPNLQKRMEKELVASYNELPEELKSFSNLQTLCLEECLPICQLAYLFNDFLALHGFRDGLDHFPDTLANFMMLEGFEEVLNVPDVLDQPQELLSASPLECEVAEQAEDSLPLDLEKCSLTDETLNEEVVAQVEPVKLESLSVRKVLQQLSQRGFFVDRQKGGHLILKIRSRGAKLWCLVMVN